MLWWLVSRASGTVALVLVSLSVTLGLAMAAKLLRRPAAKRMAASLHQYLALIALSAVGIHGLALLGDRWLRPGWSGILVPFAVGYRPLFTGAGIVAGYLMLLLGPSFYIRRSIGARRWRSLHRATVLVWALAAVHTLGAGSDGGRLWMRALVLAPVAPVVYLLVVRLIGSERSAHRAPPSAQRPRPGERARRSAQLLNEPLPPS